MKTNAFGGIITNWDAWHFQINEYIEEVDISWGVQGIEEVDISWRVQGIEEVDISLCVQGKYDAL